MEGENSGKKGGEGRDWGDLNVHPLNASLEASVSSFRRKGLVVGHV